MSAWHRFWQRGRFFFNRSRFDQEMDEEMRLHLEMKVEESVASGMPRDEAERVARRGFGNTLGLREQSREQWGWGWLEDLAQDLRFGARMLRKAPLFTAIVVITLALGIGANTAIFSVVDAVLLRPLPFPHPGQLVNAAEYQPVHPNQLTGASYVTLQAWREQSHGFSALAGMTQHQLTLTGLGEPTEVDTIGVTADFFPVYQAKPLLGRTLAARDGERGAAAVAVLSENLWRSRFGASTAILGHAITLDQRAFTVVGVMPASFHPPFSPGFAGVWIPLVQDPLFGPWMTRRGGHWLGITGRLNAGVTLAQAQAELAAVTARLAREFPAADSGWRARVRPLHQALVGQQSVALLVLLGAVGLLLLIACANIASLLLARAGARGREMGVRLALGAGRGRLIRQLLTESLLLGLMGALAGLLLAWGGVRALVSLLPAGLPQYRTVAVDGRVLLFALGLSLAASLLFGLAPALMAADSRVHHALREGTGRVSEGHARRRARGVLMVTEIALAVVLLVGAGLLLRSFDALTSVDPGFSTRRVYSANIALPQYEYSTPRQWTQFAGQLLARVQAQPGMKDAAMVVPLPLTDGFINLTFTVAGAPPLPRGTYNLADFVSASPGYFHLMGIRLLSGRLFDQNDTLTSPHVALISAALARRYFPHENPIGRRLIFGFPPNGNVPRQIVGVVSDVRDASLAQPPGPMMYAPFAQAPFWGGDLVVKSSLAGSVVAAGIRRQVAAIDPGLPVTDFQPLANGVSETAAQPRFRTLLLTLFGLIALALAASGIYGIISYSVSRRVRELGVRIALGATPAAIQRMVLREGGRLATLGLAIGCAAALGLTRFLRGELYGIRADDPLTYGAIALLLGTVALMASYLPARRAAHVDPLTAIRND